MAGAVAGAAGSAPADVAAAGVTLLMVRPDAATGARISSMSLSAAFLLGGIGAWRAQSAARRLF